MKDFCNTITAFIKAHGISERRFGMEALNDKNFVADLRGGRSPTMNTVERVQSFMTTYPNHKRHAPSRRKQRENAA